ncbi:hypothetical protein Tco_0840332 [Tanacetum coccineum]|uniref:Uncharacterized protein n=1 Tax=Tanacetum coccineum TaxID=301880 RepID=A0ABQ5AT86_9ASTR
MGTTMSFRLRNSHYHLLTHPAELPGYITEFGSERIHKGEPPWKWDEDRMIRRTRRREEKEKHIARAELYQHHDTCGERLARCMAPPAHSPPLPPSSGCLTQIQTLRIASTQALIDAVTAALPPLPPSLPIPSPVDPQLEAEERRQGIRDVGYGIRDTWVDPAEVVPEIAPMTVGEVNTRVVELAELHERDTQDLYALLEDAQDGDSPGASDPSDLCMHMRPIYSTPTQLPLIVPIQNTAPVVRTDGRDSSPSHQRYEAKRLATSGLVVTLREQRRQLDSQDAEA